MQDSICPDFSLPATSDQTFSLTTAKKPLVIYFYPKDNTPGCTNEAIAFRDLYPAFSAAGAEIVGISRDSLKSHEKFREKFSLPFELLSDSEETVCRMFNVNRYRGLNAAPLSSAATTRFCVSGVESKYQVMPRRF
jgi:peroxiredoxin Q/BCP